MHQKKNRKGAAAIRKSWVAGLACLVALVSIGTVMRPAVAMEPQCGLEEHRHGPECYIQMADPEETSAAGESAPEDGNTEQSETAEEQWELICQLPEHVHTEVCTLQQEQTESPVSEPQQEQPEQETFPKDGIARAGSRQEQLSEDRDDQQRTPIDLNKPKYIQHAELQYKDKTPGSTWQKVEPGVTVPGDARLHLEVGYDHVSIRKLIANGGELLFQVPEIMRNPVAKGDIQSGQQTVGTIEVSGNQMLLRFYIDWLQGLLDQQETSLFGAFYVESDVNLSVIPDEGGSFDIVIGGVELKPDFEPDMVARYGSVEIQKVVSDHVIENEQIHRLEYQLKVKAGVDGSPAVSVVDRFTINGQYVEYEGITAQPKRLTDSGSPREQILEGKQHGQVYKGALPTEEVPIPPENSDVITEPGSLVWNIGALAPNEERTLVYHVRLQEPHGETASEQPLRNEAKVYSKTYKKDDALVDFVSKANLDVHKSHTQPQRNADGSYTITYTVRLTAADNNNHDLLDVQVTDSLNHRDHATNSSALKYITYQKESFRLFHSADLSGPSVPVNGAQGPAPTLVYGQDERSFTLSVGDMTAGESYSFQYSVRVGVEAFAAGHLESLDVKNRVLVTAENATSASKPYLDKHDDTVTIDYRNWIQKAVADVTESPVTIPLGTHVYAVSGDSIVQEPDHPGEFIVPAGSYPYSITLNHLGDFDITAAEIRDTLESRYLRYTGYLRIDAFDAKQTGEDPLGILAETRWLKIDGGNTFRFHLTDVGFLPNQYAYRLSYYAMPTDVDDVVSVQASNTAGIQGQVSTKDHTIMIDEFQSQVNITISGGHSFEVQKHPWYYEKPAAASGAWSKGAIYWGIQIDGTNLYAGTTIKDYVSRGEMYFHEGSMVGLYRGKFPAGTRFNDFADVQTLIDGGYFTEIPGSAYRVTYTNDSNLQGKGNYSEILVEMLETQSIGAESSLYLIVKGEPKDLPYGNRNHKNYTNYVATKTGGTEYVQRSYATKTLYAGQNIMKEFGSYVSFDGEHIRYIQNGKAGRIPEGLLTVPGHYIAWGTKLNYGGDLSGRYRVIDELPEGLEPAFARMKWLGYSTMDQNIRMEKIEGLGPEWTEHSVTAERDENQGTVTSYYYTNGRKILWEVDNLIAGHQGDEFAVDFQVVARVTDPDVLQGGANKEFVNQISLWSPAGQKLDSAASGVRVSAQSIDKSSVRDKNEIHYTIELNPVGEDLLPGAEQITLVDEMSDTLILDVTSIEVVNSRDGTPVPFQASMGTKELFLTVPDSVPLTVRYTARVYAVPDSVVTLSNQAYWMGYDASTGDGDRYDNFHYTVGGTAGSGKFPHVQVLKFDKDNITSFLEGAVFQMEEGKMVDGTFVPTEGKIWKGTTGSDGMLTFGSGTEDDPHLDYNVVYRVTEQQAPAGYQVDSTPQYLIIAKKVGNAYPTYPDNVHVHYDPTPYVFRMANRRMEAYVEKQFEGADGTPIAPLYGTYRFGIFENPQGAGQPLQIAELVIDETSTDNRAVLRNLEENKTYYVFELDDNDKPILPGKFGTVGRIPFQVSYSSQLPADMHAVSLGLAVTVTNRMTVEKLPETGGIGTAPYRIAGLVLVCGSLAAGGLCYQKRKLRYK